MSADPQPYESPDHRLILVSPESNSKSTTFPFLSLPTELRLKVYSHLLPPRHHKIATLIPTAGNFFFYNTSPLPLSSNPTTYPFGRSAPKSHSSSQQGKAVRYKCLSANFRSGFPEHSIHTEILRVSRRVRAEAESVLYGAGGVQWDFGIHLDAMRTFWGERSVWARENVRCVRIAMEIPSFEGKGELVDEKWRAFCQFLREELSGLRKIDLVIWSASGLTTLFPSSSSSNTSLNPLLPLEPQTAATTESEIAEWRKWPWTADLLSMQELQELKITWWGFQNIREEGGRVGHFDSWLAGRMVGDEVVRERMVREGVVDQGGIVIPGLGRQSI